MKTSAVVFIALLFSIIFALSVLLPIDTTKADDIITVTRQFAVDRIDNDAYVFGEATTYSTARTTATSEIPFGGSLVIGQDFSGGKYKVYRSFLKFDTSRIPDNATILSAKLYLYGEWDQSATDFVIRIQKWTGDTPVTTDDYNQFDGVNYDDGTFNTANFLTWQWNVITISNFNIINKTGYTTICLRSSRDINSNTPTGAEFVHVFAKDWLGNRPPFLEITYSYPLPKFTVIPNWLVGGENGCLVAIDVQPNSSRVEDLSDWLGTNFDISTLRNGYGFLLIGLEDEPMDVYGGPGAGPRIVKFDGKQFTNVAPSVEGVQIMDIARYRSKFLIGGYYKSSGHYYAYGRLYTYDGQTFNDVTSEILGGYFEPMITCLADCENYWLIGAWDSERNLGYLYKWDGKELTTLLSGDEFGAPTEIEWNGEYALIGFEYGIDYAPLFKYDGKTLTDLSEQADFPATTGIGEISWNGTHFLISNRWHGGYIDETYLKLFDGENFTTLTYGIQWNAIEWCGSYWMLGGRTETEYLLMGLDVNGEWTDYSSAIWFEPTALCPGAVIIYVKSEPEINARFSFQGVTYRTPVVVPCYFGNYRIDVIDIYKEINDTRLAFNYMIYSASPPIQISSSSTTLSITNDANLTLVYFVGGPPKIEPPTPPALEEQYCLPLTFYILLLIVFIVGLIFYSQRETWKTAIPLIPIILWLLIFQPKIPVEQMPIAILRRFIVPPWHLYMAALLTIVAVATILTRKE
ncbi:MAG: DNRLRE domain-containing protein [Candidatus Bathyarchaeota archaeon]|nr:DNRLRE domain-containing protein [Candidatus Bathyarchaeota archaeon]MDW8022399.1 DNRLRE domain-containing protein [Nitrososphaerota archaeon]